MAKPSLSTMRWLGVWGIGLAALGLRLWGLARFQALVFDEIYYVPFALGYLHQTPIFDAHPPLGKYMIALGIGLGQGPTAWFHWPTIWVEGQAVSPLSFRSMNAVVGATVPLIVAALAFHLSQAHPLARRWRFGLLAGGLMVLEGLTLVESRLALINLYWLWFGLVGQGCWLVARASSATSGRAQVRAQVVGWRMAAGMALGAAVNVKWNGAGFWLGLLLWELREQWQSQRHRGKSGYGGRRSCLGLWCLGFYLGVLPLATYSVLWLPHLNLTGETFGAIHQRLWMAHQTIGTGSNPHPYCSAWHTWPLMVRPIAYFHEAVGGQGLPRMMTPYRAYGESIFTIQAMGNPVLWWLGTAAVLALGLALVGRWQSPRSKAKGASLSGGLPPLSGHSPSFPARYSVETFLLINYLANWLPWMLVSRCTFLYHALGMVAFSTLALAWLLAGWVENPRHRPLALVMLGAIVLSFGFWLPVFLGLPLSPEALQRRWWLPTWI